MPAPVFIEMNAFRPDGGAFGPELGLVQNYLPVHAGWHSLRKKQIVASVSDGPMTGAYVHIYQQEEQIQKSRPSADSVDGDWLPSAGDDLFARVNEATPSDAEFIFAPNAPAAEVAYLAMAALTDPLSAVDHFLRWRYRIPAVSGTWTLIADLVSVASAFTSLERSGSTATGTTAEPHGLATGQVILVEFADQAPYNGRFTITVIGLTQFTYTVSGSPATPATGTPTWRAVWVSDTATGSAATAFLQREKALTAGEANAIDDYATARLRLEATVPGTAQFARPAADAPVGAWVTQAGGSTDLYQGIDETSPSDADYIQSPALAIGGAAYTYGATLAGAADPLTDAGFTFRFRYQTTNAGVTLKGRLKQGATTVREITITNAATAWTTSTTALTANEMALVTDFAALTFEAEASYPAAAAATAWVFARPSTDELPGTTWEGNPATSPLALNIDETSPNDADWVSETQVLLTPVAYVTKLSSVPDPLTNADHILRVRARRVSNVELSIEIRQGALVVASRQQALTTLDATYTFNLTEGEASLITDYADITVAVNKVLAPSNGEVYVTWIELAVPELRKARVSQVEVEAPSASRAEVSWAEWQVPETAAHYKGDVPTILCGSKTNLYEVTSAGFTSRSKVGGYGTGAKPGAWRFCSFGNDPIATNRADPVQYRAGNAGAFADLITTPSPAPKARFCCIGRNHLFLGDINLTGHFSDEIWYSYFDNARDLSNVPQGQGNNFRIVSRPGQLMGLVGGDFVTAFKRNSMHLIGWQGGSIPWRLDDISAAVGTPYPSSVVQTPYGIFFFDGATFRRYNGGTGEEAVADVGTGILSQFLTDVAFSSAAIAQIEPGDISVEDQILMGHWDPFARVVIWHYQSIGEDPYEHIRGIAYNPQEDRWGAIYDPNLLAAVMACKPNVTNSDTFLLKGSIGFDWNGTTTSWFRFDGADTYEGLFNSKRQALGIEGVEEPEKAPQAARLKGLLPIFSHVPVGSSPPNLTVTVTVANDPWFSSGVQTKTTDVSKAAISTGIMPCDVTGTWFLFSVTIPELTAQAARAFRGLYAFWDYAGSPGGM